MNTSLVYTPENLRKRAEDLTAIYLLMGRYYEGVETANLDLLDQVFHEEWYMRDTDL